MKIAIILFNLGGPDSLEAVQPFLQNLFSDKGIIGLPALMRLPLARLIAKKRAPTAREIYAQMNGRSPILPQTEAQAAALQSLLGNDHKVFIAMRYWQPLTADTVREVKAWDADRVVLLPLYPQFSTTTTGSSRQAWLQEARRQGLTAPVHTVGCYYDNSGFVLAMAALIREHSPDFTKRRLLFSAHGLPEKTVRAGDPYQWQVEQTVAAIVRELGVERLDAVTCYQSRVGPLQWIKPSTDCEIRRAGRDGAAVTVVPVAFVSEHSETLVELDIEYRELASESGVHDYKRVPTVQTQPLFIEGLAALVHKALGHEGLHCPAQRCPAQFNRALCQTFSP